MRGRPEERSNIVEVGRSGSILGDTTFRCDDREVWEDGFWTDERFDNDERDKRVLTRQFLVTSLRVDARYHAANSDTSDESAEPAGESLLPGWPLDEKLITQPTSLGGTGCLP